MFDISGIGIRLIVATGLQTQGMHFVCLYCCMRSKLSLFRMPTYVPYIQHGM